MDREQGEVIIIGGGISGLAAAAFLARQGRPVRLFEQSEELGGRARTKELQGFHMNMGPHALYRMGAGLKVLRELGVDPKGGIPPVSGGFAVKDRTRHTLPVGFVSLLTTGLLGLSGKIEAGRVLGSLAKIRSADLMGVSVNDWVNETIANPDVREYVLASIRLATYTNAPEHMSAGSAIAQLQMALAASVLYIDGGWQTMVDGLADVAASSGAILEAGTRVDSIQRSGSGAVEGVLLGSGRTFKASEVIIASTPAAGARLLGDKVSSLSTWAAQAIPVRAACLDVALTSLPHPKFTFALGIDQPLYLSVHSAAARLAPEGAALIQLGKYLPPDSNQPAEEIRRELESLLDLIQPGWRDRVVHSRLLPDMAVANALTTARQGGIAGRPGPEVPGVPGLYVAGDWVGAEGLLADASLASAKLAAELILKRNSASLAA